MFYSSIVVGAQLNPTPPPQINEHEVRSGSLQRMALARKALVRQFAVLCVCLALGTTLAIANSTQEKALLGRKMYSAFMCATYAEMAARKDEQARLFAIGLEAGQEFLRALKNKEIPEETLRKEAPLIGVLMRLGGPSDDFMLSRLHAGAESDAHDDVATRGENGMPLEVKDWITDPELQSAKVFGSAGSDRVGFI